jgi:hypothetical protein
MRRAYLCIAVATTLLCHPAAAQTSRAIDSTALERNGTSSVEIWAGYSPGSTSAGFLGGHAGIELGLVAMRWNNRIDRSDADTRHVYYTLDLIPVARVTPIIEYTGNAANVCSPPKFDCLRIQGAIARGVGFSPLGVTIVHHADRMLQWRFGATGGVLLFDKPAPSDLASRLNFTAAVEGGIQLVSRKGLGVLIVYRLHHLSNAGTAEDNLAILSHVFSIGGRWQLSR